MKIFFSRSKPFMGVGGGGRRRSLQVYRALESQGPIEFLSAADFAVGTKVNERVHSPFARAFWERIFRSRDGRRWGKDRQQEVLRLRQAARFWQKKVERLPDLELAVVEDPIYFEPLVRELHTRGIPIVASCQNIETLSYPHISHANRKVLLTSELEALSGCDLAVTISREDTWLLRNFNIPAYYFPYFPPAEVAGRLFQVRQNRQQSDKDGLLLLGNAGNMATRKGMTEMVEHWQGDGLSREFGKLWVAGYKTDCFFSDWKSSSHIEFLGPMADEDLDERLATVRACLCHQHGGGGALTRICEMLTAGIPVVVSSAAARSYHETAGIIEFRELKDLRSALRQLADVDSRSENIPIPVKPDAARLALEIRAIMEARRSRPGFSRS